MFEKAEAILGKKEADLLRRMAKLTLGDENPPSETLSQPATSPSPEPSSGNFSVDGVTVTGDTEDAT